MLIVFQIYTLVKLGGKMIENQIKVLAIAPYRAMAKQLERKTNTSKSATM